MPQTKHVPELFGSVVIFSPSSLHNHCSMILALYNCMHITVASSRKFNYKIFSPLTSPRRRLRVWDHQPPNRTGKLQIFTTPHFATPPESKNVDDIIKITLSYIIKWIQWLTRKVTSWMKQCLESIKWLIQLLTYKDIQWLIHWLTQKFLAVQR